MRITYGCTLGFLFLLSGGGKPCDVVDDGRCVGWAVKLYLPNAVLVCIDNALDTWNRVMVPRYHTDPQVIMLYLFAAYWFKSHARTVQHSRK